MKTFWRLTRMSWKNLTRHTRRTVITALSLAFGLGLYILMDSLLLGISLEGRRNMIWYDTGLGVLEQAAYDTDRDLSPTDLVIENAEALAEGLRAAGLPATARSVFPARVIVYEDPYPQEGSMNARLYTVDLATDSQVFHTHETVVQGTWLQDERPGVVLGAGLAEKLGAQIGWDLTLETTTRDGYLQVFDVPILGFVKTNNMMVNNGHIYMTRSLAEDLLGLAGSATQIHLAGAETADLSAFAETVRPFVTEGLAFHNWRDLDPGLLDIMEGKGAGSKGILFLFLIIAVIGVSNTMLLSILERTRELGMLRSQGMTDGEIQILLLMEAGAIGLLGGGGGLILGVLLNWPLVEFGLDFSFLMDQIAFNLPISSVYRGAWNPEVLGQSVSLGFLVSVLVAWFPVRRALKMSVTDALRSA